MNEEEIILGFRPDELKLGPRQAKIYNGLKNIGEEIAGFYLDGIRIYNDQAFISKSYLLAHLAREIDGGLRDILECSSEKKQLQKKLKKIDQENKDQRGHIASILSALNIDENTKSHLTSEWIDIASKFAGFAHRHGPARRPRDFSEMKELWDKYENVLYILMGNYLNLLERIDRIIHLDIPTDGVMEALPNLLKLESRYFYFFENLKSLKWLKPLKNAGFFNPKNNPAPIESVDFPGTVSFPYWRVLFYLETAAELNAKVPKDEISDTIVEILDTLIENRNGNWETDLSLLRIICFLPIDKIKLNYIGLAGFALKDGNKSDSSYITCTKLLPHLIKNNSKLLTNELIRSIIDYKRLEDRKRVSYIPILEWHYYERVVPGSIKNIARLCGLEALEIGIKKINDLISFDDSQFTNFKEHMQYYSRSQYNFQLVTFVQGMLKELPSRQIKDTVIKMLENRQSIFKRLALLAINYHYEDLNDIFWSLKENPINAWDLKLELYELIDSNCRYFTQEQVEKILDWIESAEYNKTDKYLAYAKKEWLTALLKTGHEQVKLKNDEYDRINNAEVMHPGHNFWFEIGCGTKSPISSEELLKKNNSEIVDYVNNYEEKIIGYMGPSKDGLANEFETVVKQNPLKFCDNLEPLRNLHKMYLSSLFRGLSEAWKQKKEINEEKIFEFILRLLRNNQFWEKNEETVEEDDYTNWTANAIAELLDAGLKDDGHAFEIIYLEKIEEILLILLNQINSHLKEGDDLILYCAANSTKGMIISALINYSLLYAKVNNLKNNRWKESVKAQFDRRLDGTVDYSLEYFVCLGQYFYDFYYLDENWVEENIRKIFSQTNDSNWKATASAYFLFTGKVYEDIYELLKYHGIFEKALTCEFENAAVLESLINHICICYVYYGEDIEDQNSLISKALSKKEKEVFDNIIRYFQFHPNKEEVHRPKVRQLWENMLNVLTSMPDNIEFKYVAAELWRFILYFDELDDQLFEWLNKSVKCFERYDHESGFIEYLSVLVEKYPQKAGELCINMLQAGAIPTYQKEKIEKILSSLYQKDQKEYADEICNLYAANGLDAVTRELYKKYNQII